MRLSSFRIREVISLWSSRGVSAKHSCSFSLDAELQKSERKPAQMAFPPDSEHIQVSDSSGLRTSAGPKTDKQIHSTPVWGGSRFIKIQIKKGQRVDVLWLRSVKALLLGANLIWVHMHVHWNKVCLEEDPNAELAGLSKRKSNFGGWGGQLRLSSKGSQLFLSNHTEEETNTWTWTETN